jgi:hypothetical protein
MQSGPPVLPSRGCDRDRPRRMSALLADFARESYKDVVDASVALRWVMMEHRPTAMTGHLHAVHQLDGCTNSEVDVSRRPMHRPACNVRARNQGNGRGRHRRTARRFRDHFTSATSTLHVPSCTFHSARSSTAFSCTLETMANAWAWHIDRRFLSAVCGNNDNSAPPSAMKGRLLKGGTVGAPTLF